MKRAAFERLVARAVDSLPAEFRKEMKNLAVVVESAPSAELLDEMDVEPGDTLLGLYQGTPLTSRGWDYGNALPDRIIIFQDPIEELCEDEDEIIGTIGETVIHEVGHYFGMSEEQIEAIEEEYWRDRNEGRPERGE
jgi:predicted Zn-dependent protease with MMP-like domain